MKKLFRLTLALVMSVLVACTFVACENNNDGLDASMDSAIAYVREFYANLKGDTASDYTVMSKTRYGTDTYDITWTVNVTEGVQIVVNEGTVTVDVNEMTDTPIPYTLTATITKNGKSKSCSFNLTVPKYEVLTYAQAKEADNGSSIRVQGIVTGITLTANGTSGETSKYKECLYVQDAQGAGAYYIYNVKNDLAGKNLELGDTVIVEGEKTFSYNQFELKDANVSKVDAEKVTVEPIDLTEAAAAATNANDETLRAKNAMLVKIDNVMISNHSGGDSTYFGFKMADGKVESYIRISTTVCPLTPAQQETLKATHAANIGKLATVKGVVSEYSNNFYLTPVTEDAFSNFHEADFSDEEKLNQELEAVTLTARIAANGEFALPMPKTFTEAVTFTWTTTSANLAIADGKMTVTLPAEGETATLTLTATCGEKTETVEFTVLLKAPAAPVHAGTLEDPFSATDAAEIMIALGKGESYQAEGSDGKMYDKHVYIKGYVVDAGSVNGTYGLKNVYIADSKDAPKSAWVLIYSINWSAGIAAEGDLAVGDLVIVDGFLKDYSGTKEIAQGKPEGATANQYPNFIKKIVLGTGATEEDALTVAQINELNLADGAFYTDKDGNAVKVYVTGKVNAAGTTADGAVTGLVLYDLDSESYEADVNAAFGTGVTVVKKMDTIVVYGYVKNVEGKLVVCGNDTDNALIVVRTEGFVTPANSLEAPMSVADLLTVFGTLSEKETYSEKMYVVGVVSSVDFDKFANKGTYYNNLTIADANDENKTVLVYSANWIADSVAEDHFLHVGDTVVLYGWAKIYGNVNELANNGQDYTLTMSITHAAGEESAIAANAASLIKIPEAINSMTAEEVLTLPTSMTVCGKAVAIAWTADVAECLVEGKITLPAQGTQEVTFTATFTVDGVKVEQTAAYKTAISAATVEVKGWSMVMSVADLKAGDIVIMSAMNKDDARVAMGAQSGKFRAEVAFDLTNVSSDVVKITLEAGSTAGTFAFKLSDGGYLAAPTASSNDVRTVDAKQTDGSTDWKIEIDATTGDAMVTAQGGARTILSYNPTSPRFTCYANTNQKRVQFFKEA